MKFKPHRYTVADICNGWADDNMDWWSQLDGIDELEANREQIDTLHALAELTPEQEAEVNRLYEVNGDLEKAYLIAHENDVYEVQQAECYMCDRAASARFDLDQYFTRVA